MINKNTYRLTYYTIITVILLTVSGCGGGNSSEKKSITIFNLQTTIGTVPTDAAWVAYKDGDTDWKVIPSTETGKYNFPIINPTGKYSIAIASQSDSGNFVQIYNSTISELPRLRYTLPGATAAAKYKLSITTSGVTSPENSLGVYVGNSGYIYNVSTPDQVSSTNFNLTAGKYDVVAVPSTAGEIPSRLFIARNIDLSADSNMNIILGSDSQTFNLLYNYTVKMFNMPQESATSSRIGYMGYKTRNGTWISFSKKSATDPYEFSYPKMPENYMWPGDMYQVNMAYSEATFSRQTQLYFGKVDHKLVYLAPDMADSEYKTVANSGYFTPEVTLPTYPNVLFYSVNLSGIPSGSTTRIAWDVLSTTGWLNGKKSIAIPDLSKLTGWKSEWAISNESDVAQMYLYATACNRPLIQYAAIFSANFSQIGDTEITACMKKIIKSNRSISTKEDNIIKEIRVDLL
ncbi:MAG: hypothetical protein WCO98_10155 [bacterium]